MAVVKKIINNKLLLRMWRKMALLCTDAGNINWFSHYGKEYEGSFLKKKKKKKKMSYPMSITQDFRKKKKMINSSVSWGKMTLVKIMQVLTVSQR